MVNLPLLRTLDVMEYGLFPGDGTGEPGLHVRFTPGLTLVLGANGLGKTTLVMMLHRLLTGPNDISALTQAGDLGNASLRVVPLRADALGTFAQRVADGATDAVARLTFDVDGTEVSVERSLRDLTLRSFSIDGSPFPRDEEQYQLAMANLANVSTFSDWILLLRYIVFYSDDRRSLLWDRTAQRQLLRVLFLEPDQGQHWADREREILAMDSNVRNEHVAMTKLERLVIRAESRAADEPATQQELQSLENQQQEANEALEDALSAFPEIEARCEGARLRFLTLRQEREDRYRELERARLLAVNARLPQHSDSARYILAQLLAEARCLVCDSHVPDVSHSLESRIQDNECVVCGSKLPESANGAPIELADARITDHEQRLLAIDSELQATRITMEECERERDHAVDGIQRLHTEVAENRARIEQLVKRLPPEEGHLHQQQRELTTLRAAVMKDQQDLEEMRLAFEEVIASANATVQRRAGDVQGSFSTYAGDFLVEHCRLLWSPMKSPLGQLGRMFDFPAFEVELGGSDFNTPKRRSVQDDVSESQREFIDISFRMALATVATTQHATTLVMDAPESSLDAVFADRAAKVLGTFARSGTGNCLIVTSNVVDGGLIPALLREGTEESDRYERVVDLLAVAVPTAAVLSLQDRYTAARDALLGRANE